MCLAVPARVTTVVEDGMSQIDILGVTRHVSLQMVPEATVGDWVLVHAGFAIQIVDEAYARESLELLRECEVVDDEGFNAAFGDASCPVVASEG